MSLTIRKDGNGWSVEGETSEPALAAGTRASAPLELDVRGASQMPVRNLDELRAYGRMLGEAVFVGDIRAIFHEVLDRVPHGDVLHVSLSVEDVELRSLRWERLCCPLHNRKDSPWEFLHLRQETAFSLDLRSANDRRYPAISRVGLKALVVVADMGPTRPNKLAEFNASETVAGIRAALGKDIACHVLASSGESQLPNTDGLPTLDEICRWLTRERFAILHLVCHGEIKQSDTFLYLRKAGEIDATKPYDHVARVSGTDFLQRLRQLQALPHLTFLCSCSSASTEAEQGLGGLGQRLVRELAMPAVVAMTEPVPIDLATEISREFYNHLRQTGEVDRALTKASASQAGRPTVLVPTHFSRLAGRRLFDDSLELTTAEWEHGLHRLPALIQERAPVLATTFEKLLKVVQPALEIWRIAERSDEDKRTEDEKQARHTLLTRKAELNELCEDFLENSFDHLAKDKQLTLQTYDDRCPFPGLGVFDAVKTNDNVEDFRPFFFGRDKLKRDIRESLTTNGFLAVLGGSGSGKSSLIRAGLLEDMRREKPDLQAIVFPPGKDPLGRLQTELTTAPHPDILVVDQFEELFTLCTDLTTRKEFLKQLLPLKDRVPVVITMRVDFLGECASNHDDLHQLLNSKEPKYFELIQPLRGNELRSVVELQAQAVKLRFEPGLAASIFDDLEGEPGEMALLQHCLRQLWQYRHGRRMPLCRYRADESQLRADPTYRHVGGVQGAIGRSAEECFRNLVKDVPEASTIVQGILERLVRIDVDAKEIDNRRDTRRRAELADLIPKGCDPTLITLVINKLADAKLLMTTVNATTNQTEVEISHEALVKNWPRLHDWLDAARSTASLRERILIDADRYRKNPVEDNLSLRGTILAEAESLLRVVPPRVSERDEHFVNECRVAANRQKDLELRAAKAKASRALVIMWSTIISVVLLVTTVVAVGLATQAKRNENIRLVRLRVSNAIAARDHGELVKAAHLFEAAAEIEPADWKKLVYQHAAHVLVQKFKFTHDLHHDSVSGVTRCPSSHRLISWGDDGKVLEWNSEGSSKTIVTLPSPAIVLGVACRTSDSSLMCWGTDDFIRLRAGDSPSFVASKQPQIMGAVFCGENQIISWGEDGRIDTRNAQTLDILANSSILLSGNFERNADADAEKKQQTSNLVLSPSSKQAFAFTDAEFCLWQTENLTAEAVVRQKRQVAKAFFIDDSRLALLGEDKIIQVIDAVTAKDLGSLKLEGDANDIQILPGGHFAARTTEDIVYVWKDSDFTDKPTKLHCQPQENPGIVFDVTTGKSITWSNDGTLFSWNSFGGQRIGEGRSSKVSEFRVMNDGLVISSGSDRLAVWDLNFRGPLIPTSTLHHGSSVSGFHYDSNSLTSWSYDDGSIRTWEFENGFPSEFQHNGARRAIALVNGTMATIGPANNSREPVESPAYELAFWSPTPLSSNEEVVRHRLSSKPLEVIQSGTEKVIVWCEDGTVVRCDQQSAVNVLSPEREDTAVGPGGTIGSGTIPEILDVEAMASGKLVVVATTGIFHVSVANGDSPSSITQDLKEPITSGKICRSGETVVFVSPTGHIKTWRTGDTDSIVASNIAQCLSIHFSETEDVAAIRTEAGVTMIDLTDNVTLNTYPLLADSKAFTIGTLRIAAWNGDSIQIIDRENGFVESEIHHEQEVDGVIFAEGDRIILSWGNDCTIRIWDLETRDLLMAFPHRTRVQHCGTWGSQSGFFSLDDAGVVAVWDFSNMAVTPTSVRTGTRLDDSNRVIVPARPE